MLLYFTLAMIANTHAATAAATSKGIIRAYSAAVIPEISPFIPIPAIRNITIGSTKLHRSEIIQKFLIAH